MPKVIHEADVFAAVSKVFTKWGYENSTTKRLAEAAGMHEATLFRKYQSKEKLFIKAMKHEFSHVPLHHVKFTGNLEADLINIANAYIDTVHSHGDMMSLLFLEVPRYPVLKEALDVPIKNIQTIMRILAQYQAKGLLVEENVMDCVAALIGPLMAKQMFSRMDATASPSEFKTSDHVDFYLLGRKPS